MDMKTTSVVDLGIMNGQGITNPGHNTFDFSVIGYDANFMARFATAIAIAFTSTVRIIVVLITVTMMPGAMSLAHNYFGFNPINGLGFSRAILAIVSGLPKPIGIAALIITGTILTV
jgi:hypothetical protein